MTEPCCDYRDHSGSPCACECHGTDEWGDEGAVDENACVGCATNVDPCACDPRLDNEAFGPMSANAQVAAAYRVAATYRKLADNVFGGDTGNVYAAVADDLTDTLDRAGRLRPASLNAENIRARVLSIHLPVQVWTDSTVSEDGSETEDALYDDVGHLVFGRNERTVCEGCGITRDVPWPCATVRAVEGA